MVLTDLEDALDSQDLPALKARLQTVSRKDVVQSMGRLDGRHRAVVFRLLDKDRALRVFEALGPPIARELIRSLQDEHVLELFENLDPDDRVPAAR